uniref:MAM domain-containing glycosylphosphatidylinositol anchor protein 1 n=1 Tax=Ciona savignyi TaxID=51511 RepID=H2YNR0_CIOSA
ESIYNIKEYDNVVLTCIVSGHPLPRIRWSMSGGALDNKKLDLQSPILRIYNITRRESCRAVCRATNGIERPAVASKRINVLYLDRPVLTAHLTNKGKIPSTSIWFENTIYLHCSVTSNPPASFSWLLNGQRLLVRRVDPYNKDISTVILKIKDAGSLNIGNYQCHTSLDPWLRKYGVSNTKDNFTYTTNIAPPRIQLSTPSLIVVNTGDRVRMQCNVTGGIPVSKLDWATTNGVFSDRVVFSKLRNELIVDSVRVDDSADYFCIANNQVGIPVQKKTTLIVRNIGPMTYWLTPDPLRDDRSFAVNTDIKLTCHADAAPYSELTYFWYKKQCNRVEISFLQKQISRSNNVQLEIRSLNEDDYGTYVCSARLAPNGTESQFNLDTSNFDFAAPAKIFASNSLVVVTEGSSALLQCRTSGKPKPLVLWFRNENTTLPSGEMQEVTQDGILTINQTSRDHADLYTCTTARFNGFSKLSKTQSEAVVELQVQYAPTVEPSYVEIRRSLGSDVTLSCFVSDASPMAPITYVWKKENVIQSTSFAGQQLVIQSIGPTDYGVYVCEVTNVVGKAQCVLNVTAFAFPPEFLFTEFGEFQENPTGTIFPQTGTDSDTFIYLLSWTQKHPKKPDKINSYRIKLNCSIFNSYCMTMLSIYFKDALSYGELLTYQMRNLVKGMYEVEVTPKTIFGYGDSSSRQIMVRDRNLSYFCKFEDSDLCGFIQEKHPDMDSIDWTKNSAKTQGRRTKNTGPVADHSTLSREGAYMYIEASVTKKNDRARLLSPVFFDKSSFQQCLKFWYHMKGRHIGVLRVLVKKRGENETEIWRLSGAQGNTWRTGLVTITHTTPYQLIFEAIMTYDNGYQGDIAIDDILLADGKCSYRPTTT